MRIAAIFPRGSRFTPVGATALDLCLRDLVRHLPDGHEAEVFAADIADPFDGLVFHGLPVSGARRVERGALRQALTAYKADVHWVQASFEDASAVARWFPNTPVFVHRHRTEATDRLKAFWRQLAYMRRLSGLIYVSQTAADSSPFRGVPRLVVPNALDMTAVRPADRKSPLIVYSGRLAADKGVLALAEGAAAFLSAHPEWRLAIFGLPYGESDTEQRLDTLLAPVADQVERRTNAPIEDVMATLEGAQIAVAPSIAPEAFGRFSLEAMAAGCAVVHSRQPAFEEVTGGTGVPLVEVSGPAITSALTALAADPTRLGSLGAQARARAKEVYDIRKASARLVEVFDGS